MKAKYRRASARVTADLMAWVGAPGVRQGAAVTRANYWKAGMKAKYRSPSTLKLGRRGGVNGLVRDCAALAAAIDANGRRAHRPSPCARRQLRESQVTHAGVASTRRRGRPRYGRAARSRSTASADRGFDWWSRRTRGGAQLAELYGGCRARRVRHGARRALDRPGGVNARAWTTSRRCARRSSSAWRRHRAARWRRAAVDAAQEVQMRQQFSPRPPGTHPGARGQAHTKATARAHGPPTR